MRQENRSCLGSDFHVTKGISRVQLSHAAPIRSAVFDDPSLVSFAGLVPAVALADRAGLERLADRHLTRARRRRRRGRGEGGLRWSRAWWPVRTRSPTWTCCATVGWPRLFTGVRAPSTLGTFLRAFRFGHVRQLDAVAARLLAGLARHAPSHQHG